MFYRYKSGVSIDDELSLNIYAQLKTIDEYLEYSVVEVEKGCDFTDEALEFFAASDLSDMFTCIALVVHYNDVVVFLFNLGLRFYKGVEFKVFNDLNKAEQWIRKC